jgi:hypothetical protein
MSLSIRSAVGVLALTQNSIALPIHVNQQAAQGLRPGTKSESNSFLTCRAAITHHDHGLVQ